MTFPFLLLPHYHKSYQVEHVICIHSEAQSSATRDAITDIMPLGMVVGTDTAGDAGSLLGVFHIELHFTVSING